MMLNNVILLMEGQ